MSTHHGILVHAVFSTKYRCRQLHESWRNELYAYLGGIAKKQSATVIRAGGIEDHIHLLLKTSPKFAISDTLRLLKGNSSKWINQENKSSCHFAWQRGYGAFSVSQSMADVVKRYIENQVEHHAVRSFKDEYLQMLDRHQIQYRSEFVFEEELIG